MKTKCPCCGSDVEKPNPLEFVERLSVPRIQKSFLRRLAESFGSYVETRKIADAVWADDPNGGPLNALNDLSVHKLRLKSALVDTGFHVEGKSRHGYRLIWRPAP